MNRSSAAAFVSAALLLATLSGAAPASAATPADHAVLGLDQATAQPQATSPFYAGYADTGVGEGQTRADFTVPDLACDDADRGIAITLYAIQADGEFLAGTDLFVICSGGQFTLDGHITTSGGQIPIWQELRPGDVVRMSITPISEGTSTHTVAFENLTRGWTSSLPTNSPVERIEVAHRRISLDGTRVEPPSYGRFVFKNVRFDDVRLARADAVRTQLVDEEGDVMIKAGAPRGDNFRLVSRVD